MVENDTGVEVHIAAHYYAFTVNRNHNVLIRLSLWVLCILRGCFYRLFHQVHIFVYSRLYICAFTYRPSMREQSNQILTSPKQYTWALQPVS